jgi:DNA-binding CsgD family transcriptional regulator
MSAKFIRLGDSPTRRESQVAIALLFGHSAAQTAAELRMSVSTVECHRERLYRKFGAHRMGDLVRILMGRK